MKDIQFHPEVIESARKQDSIRQGSMNPYAFRSHDATRMTDEADDPRPPFFHDIDRILYSRAYSRYIDKTQVFYLVENDHITHRVLHVQLVSKIARTIGYFLNLNLDLIEAISLGHDVGHSPFGHNGETIISDFCKKHGCGIFEHNVQGFRLFHELENEGKGNNLSVQVLDGIICHNGEIVNNQYTFNPRKTPEQLLDEYGKTLVDSTVSKEMKPMTLEGCVMRISDVIAYVGRDIEDAIILNLINRKDLPAEAVSVLGNQNREIVNSLIIDLVNHSFGQDHLSFSKDVFEALNKLKEWNYRNIYQSPKKMVQDSKIRNMFDVVLETCLEDLETGQAKTPIRNYLKEMAPAYRESTSNARIVADYVSGMTDNYLFNTFKELTLPKSFGMGF